MAVPTSIADLSTTAASNSPGGSEAIGTSLDDYLRATQAIIKQNVSKGSDITSSGTISIPNAGNYFVVTGTTGITAINDTWNGRVVILKFSGALTITHSAGLILFGSNITTAAGDVLTIVNESTGVYRAVSFFNASETVATLAGTETLTNKTIVGANNTVTTAASGTITSTELNAAIAEIAAEMAVITGNLIESTTKMVFYQNSAPTGWTLDDTKDNYMVRTVASASWGTGSGGSHSPILMDKVPSHTHTFSATSGAGGSHNHTAMWSGNGENSGQYMSRYDTGGDQVKVTANTPDTGYTSTVTTHTHSVSGTTAANGSSSNWTPQYINVVIAVKD